MSRRDRVRDEQRGSRAETERKQIMRRAIISAWAIVVFTGTLPALAQDAGQRQEVDKATMEKVFKEPGYSPYAGRNFPSQVYWGNQHIHTALSVDAGAIGCRIDDELGYRFSRGEQITSSTGQPVKLSRPMDWVVISDHAEAYGGVVLLMKGYPPMMSEPTRRKWPDMTKAGGKEAFAAAWEIIHANAEGKCPKPWMDKRSIGAAWEHHVK